MGELAWEVEVAGPGLGTDSLLQVVDEKKGSLRAIWANFLL
jgi:hypothetical protein